MENESRYTPTYRKAKAQQVMAWIKSGLSGHILGLKGAGKSNFIRFLFDKEFPREHYLGAEHDRFIFVRVDLLKLNEYSEWAMYEAILAALIEMLHQNSLLSEVRPEIEQIHQQVLSNPSGLLAQRTLQRAVGLVCQSNQLVFFIDEIDKAFRELPAQAFRGLRGLRDEYKEKLLYVLVGTRNLSDLRSDVLDDVEHFYRLVERNICGLGPYTDEDARRMLDQMAARRGMALDEKITTRLIRLSGGHAGLLKTLLLLPNPPSLAGEIETVAWVLLHEPNVERECQKIWKNLPDTEKAILSIAANGGTPVGPVSESLDKRGLFHATDKALFSPIFTVFVRAQVVVPPSDTFISRSPQIVQIEGKKVEGVGKTEFELLYYLYEHRGKPCSKKDLIKQIYPNLTDAQNNNDNSLQQYIRRLREKIELDPDSPCYIQTVHSVGYKFVIPQEK